MAFDPNQTTKVTIRPEANGKKAAGAPAVLLLLNGGPPNTVGKEWTLDKKSMTMGRYPGSEICVNDASMSKAHARITLADGIYSLSDLGSTNGTVLNGDALKAYQTYQLRNNDQIKLGGVLFKFMARG